jgi:PAS domain S-box-containing protein
MMSHTNVMVVEDEALIADDIERTLIKLGYLVPGTAATGHEAIAMARTLRPGLVLMDIKLQGRMDGIQAAATIRQEFGIPVVFLTSHSDDATLARAKLSQPYGYLLKPFHDRELRIAVEVAVHKHELESHLAARERWFSTTLRSIGDAVIATDPDEIITFMNTVAERLTGWGSEAIGRPLAEVFRVVDKEGAPLTSPVHLALQKCFAVELPPGTGLVLRTGKQLSIDDSASPIIDDKGVLLGGVVVFRDVTERKKLEERLEHAEHLASLGTMAAGMSHEINNPLAYVIGNLAVSLEEITSAIESLRALGGAPADPAAVARVLGRLAETHEALRDASEGSERVRRIVQALRKCIRLEDKKPALLDLPDLLEAAIKMTDNAVRHHARVRRSFGTTPFVEAHEGQLEQVFTNLLLNAAQAIGDGHAASHEIAVSTHLDEGGQAVVEIRDTGPGIRPDILPRIFDPFFTTKPVGAGMGLGLAICRNIVGAHGGTLTAESPASGGALFRVVLPAALDPTAAASPPRPKSSPKRRGKVLVIDDEPAVANAVARMLRGLHDVTVESDGREALARIAAGELFDVIFCDMMMPNFSGIDVHEALLVACPAQAHRVVFMTGGAFSERSLRFLETTSNVQVSKPFAIETIRTLASDYLT